MMRRSPIIFLLFLLFSIQCIASEVRIIVQNVVNGEKLVLNDVFYINAHGDSFNISMYKFYISNIKLIGEDGKTFTEPESYHLVNESKRKTKEFAIKDITPGNYKAISFMIGVDSLHNVSGAQSGELDPINAMFWDWNTGYIMAKVEGRTPDNKELAFHIGGFAAEKSVLHMVTIQLPSTLMVSEGKTPVIHLKSEIAEWFKAPHITDFTKTQAVTMEGKEAVEIAENYADMFTIESIDQ